MARRMVAFNTEPRGILEINVLLNVTTSIVLEEENLMEQYHHRDYNINDQQNVGSLKKSEVDQPPSCDSKDPCSICLEEYGNGSNLELVYTKCLHVFHKECLDKWVSRFRPHNVLGRSCVHCVDLRYYE
ncbi:uncharacterized protein [Cicer arietinum]|uniref:E3 ubiquitin-protein ligase RNF13-like n=1 Tax=Cicer arietinum TaxID=3827 RepID=A0A1S2YGE9_CICAR|nr:E3 ubiquitin-protein ligase RNF13-like [Cicer arietinum]